MGKIRLSDLSEEDKKALMEEARQEIAKEELQRDSRDYFKRLRIDFTDKSVMELCKTFGWKKTLTSPEMSKTRSALITIVNMAYRFKSGNTNYNAVPQIDTQEKYDTYKSIMEGIVNTLVTIFREEEK